MIVISPSQPGPRPKFEAGTKVHLFEDARGRVPRPGLRAALGGSGSSAKQKGGKNPLPNRLQINPQRTHIDPEPTLYLKSTLSRPSTNPKPTLYLIST